GIGKRITSGQSLDPPDAIREPRICQILPAYVMERLAAPRSAHPVDLHHDKSKIRELLHPPVITHKALGDIGILWARINILYDRIAFRRIEIGRHAKDAPDIRDTVASFRYKRLGQSFDHGQIGADIRPFYI